MVKQVIHMPVFLSTPLFSNNFPKLFPYFLIHHYLVSSFISGLSLRFCIFSNIVQLISHFTTQVFSFVSFALFPIRILNLWYILTNSYWNLPIAYYYLDSYIKRLELCHLLWVLHKKATLSEHLWLCVWFSNK